MATEIIRPSSNSNTLWNAFDFGFINDAVTQPTAGDGITVSAGGSDDNEEQIWGLEAPSTLISITQAVLWIYQASEEDSKTITVRLNIGGSWQTGQTFASATDENLAWVSKTFNGTWTSADFASALVGVQVPSMGTSDTFAVDAVYVELTGTGSANVMHDLNGRAMYSPNHSQMSPV